MFSKLEAKKSYILNMQDGKERWSSKADVYKLRPNYSIKVAKEILKGVSINSDINECNKKREVLQQIKTSGREPIVVELGAGTGKFTKLLLELGAEVYAIEPNPDMRGNLSSSYGINSNLHIIDDARAVAEQTGLADGMADAVVVAQSFHWFDEDKCKAEFDRILKKGGKVSIIYNWFATKRSMAMREYHKLLRECATRPISREDDMNSEFFGNFFGQYRKKAWQNDDYLDFDKILLLTESDHCTPIKGEVGYDFMCARLKEWFDKHQKNGFVKICYDTVLYEGSLGKNKKLKKEFSINNV